MSKSLNVASKLVLCTLLSTTLAAHAEGTNDTNWMVRARAVKINPANHSDAIPALGVPADAIEVSQKWIPEVDFTYFYTKNLAAELVLTVPQKHTVVFNNSALGAFNAGSLRHLPPTLTVQWHFLPDSDIRPYVGAGVNFPSFSGVNLKVPGVTGLQLNSNSWGGALQAGVDFKISPTSFINFDLKKVQIRSNVRDDLGNKVTNVRVDPFLLGIGYGYRF